MGFFLLDRRDRSAPPIRLLTVFFLRGGQESKVLGENRRRGEISLGKVGLRLKKTKMSLAKREGGF